MSRQYLLQVAEAEAKGYAAALRMEADAEARVGQEEQAATFRRFADQWDALAASYRASAGRADAA